MGVRGLGTRAPLETVVEVLVHPHARKHSFFSRFSAFPGDLRYLLENNSASSGFFLAFGARGHLLRRLWKFSFIRTPATCKPSASGFRLSVLTVLYVPNCVPGTTPARIGQPPGTNPTGSVNCGGPGVSDFELRASGFGFQVSGFDFQVQSSTYYPSPARS